MKKTVYMDVSMMMQVNYMTGIQRVVREVALRLLKSDVLSVVLLCYNSENENFKLVDGTRFLDFYENHVGTKGQCYSDQSLPLHGLKTGSVFLDIDNTWNCRLNRNVLYPILKQSGIQIVNFIHDALPVTHPQYSHETTVMRFLAYLSAIFAYGDQLVFSSHAVEQTVRDLYHQVGIEDVPPCHVIPLGSDFTPPPAVDVQTLPRDEEGNLLPEYRHMVVEPEVEAAIAAGDYLLMVGTIEPRKNHALVLDALDAGLPLNVIIAGKIGWNVEALQKRMLSHPLYGKRLFLLNGIGDAGIEALYRHAKATVFPTFNEGFGLPLVESLQYGTPVLAADIPILREVGGDYADYFDNTDPASLIAATKALLRDPAQYEQRKAALATYQPASWDDFAAKIQEVLLSASKEEGTVAVKKVRQMVVLTARHTDIMQSLPFVEAFMPFIEELVVCCPESNVAPFQAQYKGRLKLTFRTDDQLLKGKPLPEDHQARNFFLRCMMMDLDVLDDVFIMTDDDYRPMQPISLDVFLKDGRYQAYYFYDLKEWQGTYNNYTSFDLGAFQTRDFLQSQGYPTYQYSSHQPQIIDKRIFREMLETHKGIENHPYDEWSTYFNFGLYHHPDQFTPCPNISMAWPGKLTSWNLYQQPGIFLFENYYEELYDEGRIFAGFSKTYHDGIVQENQQKAFLFRKAIEQQFAERQVFDSYSRFYFDQEGEYPAMVIWYDEEKQRIRLHAPEYIQFHVDCWTRVPITIHESVWKNCGGKEVRVIYRFRNPYGIPVLNAPETPLKTGDEKLMLPVRSPKTRIKQGSMFFQVLLRAPEDTQDMTPIQEDSAVLSLILT